MSFFNVLVRGSFASIIGVYAHSTKEKKRFSHFHCHLNLQISMKLGSLLFYKNNFIKPPASKLLGN